MNAIVTSTWGDLSSPQVVKVPKDVADHHDMNPVQQKIEARARLSFIIMSMGNIICSAVVAIASLVSFIWLTVGTSSFLHGSWTWLMPIFALIVMVSAIDIALCEARLPFRITLEDTKLTTFSLYGTRQIDLRDVRSIKAVSWHINTRSLFLNRLCLQLSTSINKTLWVNLGSISRDQRSEFQQSFEQLLSSPEVVKKNPTVIDSVWQSWNMGDPLAHAASLLSPSLINDFQEHKTFDTRQRFVRGIRAFLWFCLFSTVLSPPVYFTQFRGPKPGWLNVFTFALLVAAAMFVATVVIVRILIISNGRNHPIDRE